MTDIGDLVFEQNGRIVGAQLAPVNLSSSHVSVARPPGSVLLAWAGRCPRRVLGRRRRAYRCRVCLGAGAGLRDDGDRLARDAFSASRFWPKRGFRRPFLRLYRSIP